MSFTNHIVRALRRCSGQKQHALHIVRACRELIYQDFSTRFSRSKNKLFWLVFPFIFVTTFFLFYPSLNYYFFQDDWFVLNWVRTSNFWDLIKFRTDIIYWRPLSMPIFFKINYTFFGLSPQAFHTVSFAIFLILVLATYKLFLNLFSDKKMALIGAYLYGIWSIHFVSLSWLSTTSYIIGPLLQVLSFIFFINFIKKKNIFKFAFSFVFFLLAITSSELTLALPLIIVAYLFLTNRAEFFKYLVPFVFVDAAYLFLRFFIFPIPAKEDYALGFDLKLLTNFAWYILWALGLPESFKSLIFISLPGQSFKIITQFWQISLPFLLTVLLLVKMFFDTLKINRKVYLYGTFFLVLGLLPVLPLANHSYPMYLSFAGLGAIFIILHALRKVSYFYTIMLLVLWTITNLQNVMFTRATHWVRNEQAISRTYVDFVKKTVPVPQQSSVFVLKQADKPFQEIHRFNLIGDNLKQSLNGDDALQMVYNDTSLKSIFYKEGLNLPGNFKQYEIYPDIGKYRKIYQ